MMPKLPSLLVGVLFLGLLGCEESADIDALQVRDQIAVQSRLRDGYVPQVTLELFDGFGDLAANDKGVLESSTVELQIAGTDTTFVLETVQVGPSDAPNSRSFRVSIADDSGVPNYKARAGATYNLKVTTPGFPVLRSVTSIPRGAIVNELDAVTLQAIRATADTTESEPLAFDLKDVPGVQNFYHVSVKVSETGGFKLSGAGAIPDIETRVPLVGDRSGQVDASTQGVLFTDRDFADRSTRVVAMLPVSLLADYTNPTAVISVRTVSEEYYRYYSQRFRTPDNLLPSTIAGGYDNVSGGAGLFGAFSSPEQDITIDLR